MASQFIHFDLAHVTDFFGFEDFCSDLMSREGFESIQPLGGYHDRGRDAIHWCKSTSTATILAYSTRKDWNDKLEVDLQTVAGHQHPCDRFVFATNQSVSSTEFDKLRERVESTYGWTFELYDLKRISTLVDNNHPDLKTKHSNIFKISSQVSESLQPNTFDPQAHAAFFLGSHDFWLEQHTPLLAEHKEMPTYVDIPGADDPATRLHVSSIPDTSRLAILLGESGAGKTSSLWKIVVDTCNKLVSEQTSLAPVFISLRAWTRDSDCRFLVNDQLSIFGLPQAVVEHELATGRFLILFDSLNEVPADERNDCRYDLARFISRHPNNRYLISCRTSEYHPDLIPLREATPSRGQVTVYEICRLERDQIVQYATTYFEDRAENPHPFLDQLGVESDSVWNDQSAQVHLARIPIFLQLFLDVFHEAEVLPESRASLLKALVIRIVDRENKRMRGQINRVLNDRILGHLSFRAAGHGYELQFPERYAHGQIAAVIAALKTEHYLPPSAVVAEVWRGIVSANFLQYVSQEAVAWLHQLIRDYFLGVEAARIWEAGEPDARRDLLKRLEPRASDIACTMTLGLLGQQDASDFLWSLIQVSELNATRAFEGQSEEHGSDIANRLILDILRKNDYDTKAFNTIARVLPYLQVAEAFDSNFYATDSIEMRALLVAAVSELIIEHAPAIEAERPYLPYLDSAAWEARIQSANAAVRRGVELLRKYLRHSDDVVSFHAAKGLWEHDRPAAAEKLRRLHQSSNSDVVSMVNDLVEEWGIQ